jgi:hypothetical protein
MKAKVKDNKRVELYVPHQGKVLTFVTPIIGPNYPDRVTEEIAKERLIFPTAAETASLMWESLQNSRIQDFSQVSEVLESNHWDIMGYTGLLYSREAEGVYIEDRPTMKDGFVLMNRGDLQNRLNANDVSVRFVPFSKINGTTDLERNSFLIGLAGEEGAQKIAHISERFPCFPLIHTRHPINCNFDDNAEYDESASITSFSHNPFIPGLHIDCINLYRGHIGYGRSAFGIKAD